MKFSTEKKATLSIYTEVDYGTEKVTTSRIHFLGQQCHNCFCSASNDVSYFSVRAKVTEIETLSNYRQCVCVCVCVCTDTL